MRPSVRLSNVISIILLIRLGLALKIITLMKQQAVTQKQLKKSLIEIKENNELLRDLSRQDALTGCYNRRGFFEELRKRLSNDKNDGEGYHGLCRP